MVMTNNVPANNILPAQLMQDSPTSLPRGYGYVRGESVEGRGDVWVGGGIADVIQPLLEAGLRVGDAQDGCVSEAQMEVRREAEEQDT